MSDDELKAQIAKELFEVAIATASIRRYSEQLALTTDPEQKQILTKAIASDLHGFYTGAERIFIAIASQVDSAMPKGEQWHKELLAQMSKEATGVRGAVITEPDLQAQLKELRGFRHVFRNRYAHELKESLVLERAKSVPKTNQALKRDLQRFCQSIEPKTS